MRHRLPPRTAPRRLRPVPANIHLPTLATASRARVTVAATLVIALGLAAAARADEFGAPPEPSPEGWVFTWGGYLHGAYRWVDQPQSYTLAGRNNGFQLEQARIGATVQYKDTLAVRISLEGASEDRISQSFPGGTMTVRLRDAYVTWAPARALRLTFGQVVTPWDLDSMRSDGALPFVTRSVAAEGVQPGEGYATRGLGVDRNIGLMLHSGDIPLSGRLSVRYAVLAGNGNGENKLLNDNNKIAVFGRVDAALWGREGLPEDRIGIPRAVTDRTRLPILNLGAAFQYNPRTVGNPPDLIDQTDVGFAVDLALALFGAEVQGGFVYLRTSHDTLASTPDLERYGFWGHLRYTIPSIPIQITPGYRIASYAPRGHLFVAAPTPAAQQVDEDLGLLYHTIGVTVRPTHDFPLRMNLNYTITSERGVNVLANDRLDLDAVVVF